MTLEPGSVFVGIVIGAAAAAMLEAIFRPRRREDTLPLPDLVVYRNAQSVADWHRRRIEQSTREEHDHGT